VELGDATSWVVRLGENEIQRLLWPYRVFYYTKLADSVLIFHAFAKKTQKTPPHEIALAQKRLKEMLDEES